MAYGPEHGALFDRFFQWGYVTRNADKSIAQFRQRFGDFEFSCITNTSPTELTRPVKRACFTWIGETQMEFIEVDTSVPSIYLDYLPANDTDFRLHHLGFFIDDYQAMLKRLEREGYSVPFAMSYGDVNDLAYVDTRAQLGHYLEYVRLGEEGKAWFRSIPGFVKLA
jgi:hypothetical protein